MLEPLPGGMKITAFTSETGLKLAHILTLHFVCRSALLGLALVKMSNPYWGAHTLSVQAKASIRNPTHDFPPKVTFRAGPTSVANYKEGLKQIRRLMLPPKERRGTEWSPSGV